MRRGAIVALISIALVVAAITTGIAYFVDWLPEQASEERQGIDLVFWVTVAICIFVFAIVAAVSIYAGVKFRVRPDDESDGPPIHGHTGIEIVWTAVPTILVTVIAVLSAVVLAQNDSPKGDPLRVDVLAQQYAWQFTYPEQGGIKATNLYLPIDRSTKLVLKARDVLHSFWVPEFGQKQDAVPGIVTTIVITPTKTGEYRLICTELCGLGHALMRTRAIVLSQADFAAWTKKQPQGGTAGGGGEIDAKGIFTANCAACHTLTKAGTSGTVGPNLDNLSLGPAAVENQIRKGGGGMPPFEGQLSDAEINALVQYLTGSNG
ncbi:MAG TPA: cytochrome c oxidase subunit II [Gaiellaceae bacterium]|nr:cytochrome c oxidase subunit II [Gaiellaceae bacterium]